MRMPGRDFHKVATDRKALVEAAEGLGLELVKGRTHIVKGTGPGLDYLTETLVFQKKDEAREGLVSRE